MKRLLVLLMALLLMAPAAMAESSLRWIEGRDADRVHLRREPSTQAESLGLYFWGTQVILLDEQNGWAHVMVGAVEGWIMAKYLSTGYIPQIGPWYQVDNPDGTGVNMRTAPSMKAAVSMTPKNGRRVRLLGETSDGWSYVECRGAKGYIMTSLLSPAGETETPYTTVLTQCEGHYIHQYVAPTGQDIYFAAELKQPHITFEDVNFDGWDDIVVMTFSGASNAFYEFYVYEASGRYYRHAECDGEDDGLCNYGLYPEHGLVATYTNAGNAGLLHVWNLYRWEGTDLKLIRSAISDEWSESSFEGDTYTQIIRGDILHMTVRDHTKGSYDDCVVWEVIMPKDDVDIQSLYDEEMSALWQGLK